MSLQTVILCCAILAVALTILLLSCRAEEVSKKTSYFWRRVRKLFKPIITLRGGITPLNLVPSKALTKEEGRRANLDYLSRIYSLPDSPLVEEKGRSHGTLHWLMETDPCEQSITCVEIQQKPIVLLALIIEPEHQEHQEPDCPHCQGQCLGLFLGCHARTWERKAHAKGEGEGGPKNFTQKVIRRGGKSPRVGGRRHKPEWGVEVEYFFR